MGDTQAMIYLPQPKVVSIDLDRMKSGRKTAKWFNPATGDCHSVKSGLKNGSIMLIPPAGGRDWVLLINSRNQ